MSDADAEYLYGGRTIKMRAGGKIIALFNEKSFGGPATFRGEQEYAGFKATAVIQQRNDGSFYCEVAVYPHDDGQPRAGRFAFDHIDQIIESVDDNFAKIVG